MDLITPLLSRQFYSVVNCLLLSCLLAASNLKFQRNPCEQILLVCPTLVLLSRRSSWHSTTPRLLDQSAATMSRQSREREPRSPGGQSTGGRKSRSTAMLTKQLSGPEENGGSGAGGGNSLLNTFRRRHRSTSKSSTLSRRLVSFTSVPKIQARTHSKPTRSGPVNGFETPINRQNTKLIRTLFVLHLSKHRPG